jgi:nudix-type nucleoside diphosphatase (YffH/AdpP family)
VLYFADYSSSYAKKDGMKKVSIEQQRYLLNDFFKVEEAYLRFEQFNGEMSRQIRRLSLERGDSVAILVYNTTTEKIILINQFRYPTYQHGDGWITETIAGMADHEEGPEETARRETQEETPRGDDLRLRVPSSPACAGPRSEARPEVDLR